MKSTSGWGNNDNANNSSGFSGLPGGYRIDNGEFDQLGISGKWWTATESDQYTAWCWDIFGKSRQISPGTYGKTAGGAFSVRCIRD